MLSYHSFSFKKSEGFRPIDIKLAANWVLIWKVQSMENTMRDFGIFSDSQLTQKQLNQIGNLDWHGYKIGVNEIGLVNWVAGLFIKTDNLHIKGFLCVQNCYLLLPLTDPMKQYWILLSLLIEKSYWESYGSQCITYALTKAPELILKRKIWVHNSHHNYLDYYLSNGCAVYIKKRRKRWKKSSACRMLLSRSKEIMSFQRTSFWHCQSIISVLYW